MITQFPIFRKHRAQKSRQTQNPLYKRALSCYNWSGTQNACER